MIVKSLILLINFFSYCFHDLQTISVPFLSFSEPPAPSLNLTQLGTVSESYESRGASGLAF